MFDRSNLTPCRTGPRRAVLAALAAVAVVMSGCSGGGDLRAAVECVDAVLADVSEPWPTPT